MPPGDPLTPTHTHTNAGKMSPHRYQQACGKGRHDRGNIFSIIAEKKSENFQKISKSVNFRFLFTLRPSAPLFLAKTTYLTYVVARERRGGHVLNARWLYISFLSRIFKKNFKVRKFSKISAESENFRFLFTLRPSAPFPEESPKAFKSFQSP
jgi:hypothetical protein